MANKPRIVKTFLTHLKTLRTRFLLDLEDVGEQEQLEKITSEIVNATHQRRRAVSNMNLVSKFLPDTAAGSFAIDA